MLAWHRLVRRAVRRLSALLLGAAIAIPELSLAAGPAGSSKPLDAMSPAELERFVQQLNETANWRKFRRPGDPPDFEPGKPVKVMYGAGAFGKGGARGGAGSFRKSGLASRRSGLSSRRRGRDDAKASDSSSRSSRGGFGSSSRSGSSFGGSRSSSGSRSAFDQGGMEE